MARFVCKTPNCSRTVREAKTTELTCPVCGNSMSSAPSENRRTRETYNF